MGLYLFSAGIGQAQSIMLAGADFAGGGCDGNGGCGGFAAEPHSAYTRDWGRLPRWDRTVIVSG